ncbi:MAG: branched-chain amino acid aminotransferase [Bacteroidales bacterium OttesenSCG-928-I14]|jgi:branched-chain amino acid aminotransferase|nr:branched-chain amino acid aminotransferase [Bacteroidales bacterium OttesenSCG-928-I14]
MGNINWTELSFGYVKTDYNVRSYYYEGKWSDLEITDSEQVPMHIAATCLHYGQEVFEGLKAFRGKDKKIRIFRMRENALRIRSSARGISMPELPVDMFEKAIITVINKNRRFVPPYESKASLYIRPLLVGMSAQVGIKAANEYLFVVFVIPVGPYFREGFKTTSVGIFREYDRAAPYGTGSYKVGGNYAASLVAGEIAHKKGYSAVLYLDAKEKKYIDECGPANFFGIKNNTYITPKSSSILPSITNKSLMQLVSSMGMKVERRQIPIEELITLDEAGMCGTAAVISPIYRIDDVDKNKSYIFSENREPGPVSIKLYNKLRAIQYGDEEDEFGWITVME